MRALPGFADTPIGGFLSNDGGYAYLPGASFTMRSFAVGACPICRDVSTY